MERTPLEIIGNIIDGKKEGVCTLKYDNLEFACNFINNKREGKGFATFFNLNANVTFDGLWKDDKPYLIGEYSVDDRIIFAKYNDNINDINDIKQYDSVLGYIHIPKTGGMDIKKQFINILYEQTNFVIKYDFFYMHKKDNNWFTENNLKCFTFIRDPIERFISGFKFSHKNHISYNLDSDINSFIQKNEFVDSIFFKKQISWLNGDPKNIFLVKFNKNNNYENLLLLLKNEYNVNFNYDFTNYNKMNVSDKNDMNMNINLNVNLTQESIDILTNYYAEDIQLYSKLNGPYMTLFDLQNIV